VRPARHHGAAQAPRMGLLLCPCCPPPPPPGRALAGEADDDHCCWVCCARLPPPPPPRVIVNAGCCSPRPQVGWVQPGLQHVAVMDGLVAGQQYHYSYGEVAAAGCCMGLAGRPGGLLQGPGRLPWQAALALTQPWGRRRRPCLGLGGGQLQGGSPGGPRHHGAAPGCGRHGAGGCLGAAACTDQGPPRHWVQCDGGRRLLLPACCSADSLGGAACCAGRGGRELRAERDAAQRQHHAQDGGGGGGLPAAAAQRRHQLRQVWAAAGRLLLWAALGCSGTVRPAWPIRTVAVAATSGAPSAHQGRQTCQCCSPPGMLEALSQ
jgi:hypothetical protein